MDKIRLSSSKIETFLSCRNLYKWIYHEGLAPKDKSMPLQVGDFTHRLLHKYRTGKLTPELIQDLPALIKEAAPENTEDLTFDVAEQAANLVLGYIQRYSNDQTLTFIASEIHLEVEEPDFYLYARVDGLGRTQEGGLWRVETKTTSRLDSAFLSGLKNSLQTGINHYLLKEVMKEKIKGTIFELLVKTKIPQYERSPIPFSQRIVDQCLETARGVSRSIQRGDFYPSMRCFSYNRECEYRHLCNFDSPEVRENFYTRRDK